MEGKYQCLHIPTGKQIEREWEEHYGEGQRFIPRSMKLEKINEWNAQQAGIWQYWM